MLMLYSALFKNHDLIGTEKRLSISCGLDECQIADALADTGLVPRSRISGSYLPFSQLLTTGRCTRPSLPSLKTRFGDLALLLRIPC